MGYSKENYQWLKEHNFCVYCAKSRPIPGEVACAKCRASLRRSRQNCPPERKEEIQQYNLEFNRKKYAERKAAGLCPTCGRVPEYGYSLCAACREKYRIYYKRRSNGLQQG